MGGKYMASIPSPSYIAQGGMASIEKSLEMYLNGLVQEQYIVRVAILRDLARDSYRFCVEVINPDWSLHGRLEEVVSDPGEFPSETFRTQLLMLAG
jgi:hypothetical protein